MEDKMTWANSCAHSGPHSGGLGSIFRWYTSLCSPLISPQEVLYPMSWMAGTPALGYSLGVSAGGLSEWLAPILSTPTVWCTGTFCAG